MHGLRATRETSLGTHSMDRLLPLDLCRVLRLCGDLRSAGGAYLRPLGYASPASIPKATTAPWGAGLLPSCETHLELYWLAPFAERDAGERVETFIAEADILAFKLQP